MPPSPSKSASPAAYPAGFQYLPGVFSTTEQTALLQQIRDILSHAPLFTPRMPRTGHPFSVAMSNCGPLGWVASKTEGYRYQSTHPETHKPWPPIPDVLIKLWQDVATYDTGQPAPPPEACLINWYGAKAKMGLHVDRDEDDFSAPVVSISLGDDAWFRIGGLTRRGPTARVLLRSGDVVVLGGEARKIYHGIDRICPDSSELIGGPGRFNLTLRRVTRPDATTD